MKTRVHISLPVSDVEASARFYEKLFGQAPTKRKPDYANFRLDQPALHLSLVQSPAPATLHLPESWTSNSPSPSKSPINQMRTVLLTSSYQTMSVVPSKSKSLVATVRHPEPMLGKAITSTISEPYICQNSDSPVVSL